MKSETYTILDQLSEATNGARAAGKLMYVFREKGRWWFCGKLPSGARDFYVAYPSGHSDRSESAPIITGGDWNDYWDRCGKVPAFVQPRVPKKRQRSGMDMAVAKKYFMSYCAFAPQIAFLLCVLFSKMILPRSSEMWSLALPVCLVCMPITFVWVLAALYKPKSESIGVLGATLAVNGHFAFYGHLGYIALKPAAEASTMFCVTIMASLACSGIALLLLWDNEQTASELKKFGPVKPQNVKT